MGKITAILFSFLFYSVLVWSQQYNIVIKGGHVIDPKNNINEAMDIAVRDGKIVSVAKSINAEGASQIVNAKGFYVTPGLIDIHTHNFAGTNLDQSYMNGNFIIQHTSNFNRRIAVTQFFLQFLSR